MRSLTPFLALVALGVMPHVAMNAADSTPTVATENVALNEKDRKLLIESCHRIAFTVQATEQVLPRLTDEAAKDLLGTIKKDSEAMHRDVVALMQEKGIGTPMLEKDYHEDLAKVAKAEKDEIYSTYRKYQLDVAEDLVEDLEKAAKNSDNPDLRAFAVKWQPSVRHHHEILKKYEPVQ